MTPRPANSKCDEEDSEVKNRSDLAFSISDIQFWIDHPSLDDLTAAQTESDRQQVRRDVEECVRLLSVPSNGLASQDGLVEADFATRQPQTGQYTVRRLLGVGAFGVVLHATDSVLYRDVAIKILRPSVLLSKQARARFSVEGEALARCNCPGIVPIHDVGSIEGHPYLVMGLVDGPTLADFIKSQNSPVASKLAARIVAEVAEAVHQAHQRGILHRDLKPSNVLLRQGSDSRLDLPFTPFVSDFGLAKDLLPGSGHDHSLAFADSPIIGTVRYMSPEQATGRGQDVSVTSDVFSLGVILYQLLTLKCPFDGSTTFEIIQQVATASVKSTRHHNPKVSRELNAIVGRCLAKRPSERYQSAGELSEDLHRYLEGKPVVAKPAGPIKATLYWARRNPSLAVSSAIIWCGLLVSTVAISLLNRENLKNLQNAREATIREDASRRFALTSHDKTLRHMAEKMLQNVPQSQEKKLELHAKALQINEEYAELRGHDEESMYRLSVAHHFVANDALNCQQFELASFHRNRCLEIVGDLAKKDPNNGNYEFDLFMNRFLTRTENTSDAEKLAWLIKTREHLQSAIRLSAYNPDYEEADAGICVEIGHLTYECGQEGAREWCLLAIGKMPDLGQKYPDRPHYYKHALGGHNEIARIDIVEHKWESACDHCVQALDLIEKHFRKSKDLVDIYSYTLTTLRCYAHALEPLDKLKAIGVYDQYITKSMEMEKQENRFQFYQMYRAGAFSKQAKLQYQLGDIESSKTALAKAVETLVSYKPTIPSDVVDLAEIVNGISELEKNLNQK
jgi:serine/threonine protein kinase